MAIFGISIHAYSELKYNRVYTYPQWAIVLGWMVASSSIFMVPTVAVISTLRGTGSLKERLKHLLLPRLKDHQITPNDLRKPINDELLMNDHMNEPLYNHMNEPLNDHINEPLNDHMNEHINEPLNDHMNEPLNDHMNEHIIEPLNDHMNEPLNDHMNEHIIEPLNDHMNEPWNGHVIYEVDTQETEIIELMKV
ncbi:hypothetical protein CAPTEDRAFT_222079 [Capitella teleta]|uniref:Uncharacterized protein n=1 Tax=Capitella teleta TaxID=283909 RepID=R7T928_CAPTE|nr:hypothetical protein CAPTEDRAFT_222079 [Capitella teleta]|eukprot:ELT90204.1 hypothetical protein CAPTEDRAFT_222079 [Capitella teleta]